MRNYFNFLALVIVLIGFSNLNAGSYEDYFSAIERDDSAAVQSLLERGFDPNTRDSDGQTGLYLALRQPALSVADLLLKWPKTDLDARNSQDENPLMIACLKGHVDWVEKLVAQGADVNKPGWTPLHYAATSGQLQIMQILLEHHAYIDAASPNGTTPLMMAAMYSTPSSVKLLLEAGADPLLKNSLGLNAMDFARRANRSESVELIAAFVRGRQPRGQW